MITKILVGLLVAIVIMVTIVWIKSLVSFQFTDSKSVYCHNCHCGFCMEEPGSIECDKIRAEHGLPKMIIEGEDNE